MVTYVPSWQAMSLHSLKKSLTISIAYGYSKKILWYVVCRCLSDKHHHHPEELHSQSEARLFPSKEKEKS